MSSTRFGRFPSLGTALVLTFIPLLVSCGDPEPGKGDRREVVPRSASGESAFKLFKEGMRYYEAENYDEAARVLVEVTRLKPDHLEAHYYAGKALLKSSTTDLKGTEHHFLEVLKLRPDHIDGHIALAQAYHFWGRYEDATRHLTAVLELDPNHRGALHYSGLIALRLGDLEKARENLTRALDLDPRYVPSRLELASTLTRLGREEDALAEYQQVLRDAPGQPRALLGAGTVLKRLGRNEEAKPYLDSFRRAQALAEANEIRFKQIRVRVSVARRAYQEGRIEDAHHEEKLFKEEFWNDAEGLARMAFMQVAQSRDKEAVETFRRILDLNPTFPRANEALIDAYARLGDEAAAAQARAVFEQARRGAEGGGR